MNVKRLDHIGIVVDDLTEAKDFISKTLGLSVSHGLERQELQALFLKCGEVALEVIEIKDPELRKTRLGDQKARIEHIAFEVENLEETLALMQGLGVQITAPPRLAGAHLTFFTKADTCDGVMYQFMQKAP